MLDSTNLNGETPMDRDTVMRIKEAYIPGTRIHLISMHNEPQMTPGLKGQVSHVDDKAQIHTKWESGSSLALIPGLDRFIAFSGPTAEEYLRSRYLSDDTIWFREELPGCIRAVSIGLDRLVHEIEVYQDKIVAATNPLAAAMCKPYDTAIIFDAFLSGHVLSDEDVRHLSEKYEFSAAESQESVCPKCGSEDLEYGTADLMDGPEVSYPWECKACGSKGIENGIISFGGHTVTYSPDCVGGQSQ